MEWYKEQNIFIKILIPIAIVAVIVLFIIFIPKYDGPEENCVFISEKANLHEEYYITVLDADNYDVISILKNKNDTVKTEIIGTDKHYVGVNILIEHINVADSKETHILDEDDFKVKDHTGVQISKLNSFSKENGLALETENFTTEKAVVDYSWYGKEILPGETLNITVYFELSDELSVHNTIMVLESDFFIGRQDNDDGTDIVLAYREEQ